MLSTYDDLLSHLNAEDNDMALELRGSIKDAVSRLEELDALESFGVDNWEGYDSAMACLDNDK